MKRIITLALMALLAATRLAFGDTGIDRALIAAARTALPIKLSENDIVKALSAGVWNSNRTSVAIAVPRAHSTALVVFLRKAPGTYLSVDVSPLENTNLGRLGTLKRSEYERVVSTPVEWVQRQDTQFEIQVRTRAWRLGKRSTTSGSVVITPEGTCTWQ